MVAPATTNLASSISRRELEEIALGERLYVAGQLLAPEDCAFYAEAVKNDPLLTGYGSGVEDEGHASASGILKTGLTCYEACRDPVLRDQYFELGQRIEPHFRKLFAPAPCPMDLFLNHVRGVWPAGVMSERWRGRPMATWIARIFNPGEEALPHNDVLWLDQNEERHTKPLVGQLAVNVYLELPPEDEGGALDLWGFIPCRQLYRALQEEGTYGLDRSKMPSPLATVKPQLGQIVIFNPLMVHAVRPGKTQRCTLGCFLGYRGCDESLTVWC